MISNISDHSIGKKEQWSNLARGGNVEKQNTEWCDSADKGKGLVLPMP